MKVCNIILRGCKILFNVGWYIKQPDKDIKHVSFKALYCEHNKLVHITQTAM